MSKASQSISKKAMMTELQALATIAGGMVAGTLAINTVEKVLKVDSSSKLPKRLIAPLAVAAGSAVASIKCKNPRIKQAALGAGAAGVVRTMKAVAPNTSLLNGLGAPAEEESLGLTPTSAISQNEEWVYRDSSGHLAFPDLGEIQPPSSSQGHFIDAPAYLGEPQPPALPQPMPRAGDGILGVEDVQIL